MIQIQENERKKIRKASKARFQEATTLDNPFERHLNPPFQSLIEIKDWGLDDVRYGLDHPRYVIIYMF
jgi:hypothetical protein